MFIGVIFHTHSHMSFRFSMKSPPPRWWVFCCWQQLLDTFGGGGGFVATHGVTSKAQGMQLSLWT